MSNGNVVISRRRKKKMERKRERGKRARENEREQKRKTLQRTAKEGGEEGGERREIDRIGADYNRAIARSRSKRRDVYRSHEIQETRSLRVIVLCLCALK